MVWPTEPAITHPNCAEGLRRENAEHRTRAEPADELATRLVQALAAQVGTLADSTDLPFSDDSIDDEKAVAAAEEPIERKPHLRSTRPTGDVGQGAQREQ